MALADKPIKLCSCNKTMPLDASAIAAGLGLAVPLQINTELCRKDIAAFHEALGEEECIVACTQEASLFTEVARQGDGRAALKFVNIREHAGWSQEAASATPKIAALLALAELPEPDPVASVSYSSAGELLIIGPASAALPWAEQLAEELTVNVLITDERGGELPMERRYPVLSGKVTSVQGWLGAFEVKWQQANPIDLEVCTRCNACIAACPEEAIDFTYQIDMTRCRSHRACVTACGSIGAIDFARNDTARAERFDMILDLSAEPLLKMPQKPQGYLAPGHDPSRQALAARELARLVGEFEKPKFFAYNEKICAHSRSKKIGCTNCIDVCSTRAISPAGDKVRVEPHLCLGCGGCATVCPTGAMTYAYPRVADTGARLKKMLSVYARAGGKDAAVLFHNATDGRALITQLARRGKGLPARMIPLETFHIASLGLDVLLGALAYGASQVFVLSAGPEYDEYGRALEQQMSYAETVLHALGYSGTHFKVIHAASAAELEAEVWTAPARTVGKPATFNLSNDKRTTLEFALEHIAKQAPIPQEVVPLAAGAPYGALAVARDKCTLCMACVGACPASALLDTPDKPSLRFIERNCVQCGLCVNTCPEDAITLVPRLGLTPQVKEAVVLNETEPFHCTRCGKPFGTRLMIDNMSARLGGHSMFASSNALKRLTMCGDCRVVDMMENKDELSILSLK